MCGILTAGSKPFSTFTSVVDVMERTYTLHDSVQLMPNQHQKPLSNVRVLKLTQVEPSADELHQRGTTTDEVDNPLYTKDIRRHVFHYLDKALRLHPRWAIDLAAGDFIVRVRMRIRMRR